MKLTNELLNDILEHTTYEFESMGVFVHTPKCTKEGFCLEYRYNYLDDSVIDLSLLKGEVSVSINKEQDTILLLHAVDLYNQELQAEENHKRRSCDDDYDDRGISENMFI